MADPDRSPPLDRARLRRALLAAEPWLASTDHGPRAVDAGACDRCGRQPRLLPTCGPAGGGALCRDCAAGLGVEAWCAGHVEEAEVALRWAGRLPAHWALVVTLWWVATGEVRPGDHDLPRDHPGLPPDVRDAMAGR